MRGLNVVAITGHVGNVDFGQTARRGDEVCSFTVAIQRTQDAATWVRINVYGSSLVETCRERLKKGLKVGVEGELMNRRLAGEGESFLTEVRCNDLKFIY